MAHYNRYPQEVHEFVKENCTRMRDAELAEACNKACGTQFTKATMKSFRGNYHYKNGYKHFTSQEYMERMYPPGMYDFIKDNSWGVGNKEMAQMVNEKFGTNFTQNKMKSFRGNHHISSGETGWFQKGHSPVNKGKKLEELIGEERAKEVKEKLAPTQFKKGQRSLNALPLGTIKRNTDGYMIIKVSMTGSTWKRWTQYHRYVWEQLNGPVPEGMAVTFKNGDRTDCTPENLLLVTRGELAAMNIQHRWTKSPEATVAGLNLVKLKKAVQKRRKDGKEKRTM